MALQASGTISLLDVAAEFGGAVPHAITEYYGIAPGVPASGTIDLSDFYGKGNDVTLRIYPSSYGNDNSVTNLANAYDGNLSTFATFETVSGKSMSTRVSSAGSLAAYADYYVKSLRVYSKFYAAYRAQSSIAMTVTNRARISVGTSSGTVVLENIPALFLTFPMNTAIVHDQTVNALINAKVNTLYGYLTTMGLNSVATFLETENGGYANRVYLYEHYYDLALSGSPPV